MRLFLDYFSRLERICPWNESTDFVLDLKKTIPFFEPLTYNEISMVKMSIPRSDKVCLGIPKKKIVLKQYLCKNMIPVKKREKSMKKSRKMNIKSESLSPQSNRAEIRRGLLFDSSKSEISSSKGGNLGVTFFLM